MDNQTRDEVGCGLLSCVALLCAFMAAIAIVGFGMEGSGPMRMRPDALLNMAKWVAIIVFGIFFCAFLLGRALDNVPRPFDE